MNGAGKVKNHVVSERQCHQHFQTGFDWIGASIFTCSPKFDVNDDDIELEDLRWHMIRYLTYKILPKCCVVSTADCCQNSVNWTKPHCFPDSMNIALVCIE